jgi:hypothetical protein
MSCTCDKSIGCDPCAFCSPPGVTCLTTCAPVDPCPEKINMDCVIYSGADHTCSNITHGESISPIMLQALSLIFPIDSCCHFEANSTLIVPPPQPYTFCYVVDDGTCGRVCACDPTTTNVTVYSLDNPLVVGSILYSDPLFIQTAPEGWYGANGQCITVSGGTVIPGVAGAIQTITTCVPTTTSTSTTTTTTLAPCYCYKITMVASSTVTYINCNGSSITTPIKAIGTIFEICAQSVTTSSNYTITSPTQYCADRINCPTTTTTSTSTTTTTTAAPLPCNCISFTNYSDQATISYKDCDGNIKTETLPAFVEVPVAVLRCGSGGTSTSGKVDIIIGSACTGSRQPTCATVTTTTAAPSPWVLRCCGDVNTVITIKPSFPIINGAAFAVNNIYKDDAGLVWIVINSGGTASSSYSPLTFTYVANGTFANCQSRGVNQICPGVTTTTTAPVAKLLTYSAVNCITPCAPGGSTNSFYSNCAVLSTNNCKLYTNVGLTTLAPTGYYSDHTNSYYVNSGGNITLLQPCSAAPCITTTSTSTTTTINTKTIEIKNNVIRNSQQCGNYSGTTLFPIITAFGTWINGSVGSLPSITWHGVFGNLAPEQNITGTYQAPPNGQLGISLTATYSTCQCGTCTDPGTGCCAAYTGYYYLKVYKNGSSTPSMCTIINSSTIPQDKGLNSVVFTSGDSILIVLDKTDVSGFCS